MAPRTTLVVTVSALALAAVSCGTPAPPVAQEAAAIGDTLPSVEEVTTPPPVEELRLSVDDALLQGDDAPAPWEMQHRNVQSFAHDIGPNQTDCDPYWEYERLGRLQGGETMWWRDGGNLNNMVRRETESGQAAQLIQIYGDLPETCGMTSWSEGDSFTVEPLDLSDTPGTDGIVALSIDHVRTDEVLWLAFAQRGDLISELRVTMWPEFESGQVPAFSPSDFAVVAATMADRLALAGTDDARPNATTTVAATTTDSSSSVPGERPVETSPTPQPDPLDPEIPELQPLPPDFTLPPLEIPSTTSAPLTGLASVLLVSDELPAGWTADRPTEYDDGGTDDDPLAGCPASIVIVELDERFGFSTELGQIDATTWQNSGMQFIAETPDDENGTEIASLFLALDGCEGGDEDATYLMSATAVEMDGADAAVVVEVDQTRQVSLGGHADGPVETERFVLAIATVGATLTAFSLPAEAPTLDFLQRAVDKIVASGPS